MLQRQQQQLPGWWRLLLLGVQQLVLSMQQQGR
jgi:hypothetical protein